MFQPCWVIFREKLSVVVTLGCTIQLILAQLYSATQCNDNRKFNPEEDPAGSKHVGVCYI
jgi:hypothetical protein